MHDQGRNESENENVYLEFCDTNDTISIVPFFVSIVSAEAGNFSLHHSVQNGSGARPASYPMGIRDSFTGG